MRTSRSWALTTVLALATAGGATACSSDSTPADAGATTDTNPATDQGAPADRGATVDAGTPTDQGAPTDRGAAVDAGTPTDQGTPTDAGTPTDFGTPSDGAPATLLVNGTIQEDSTPISAATIEVVDASPAISTVANAAGQWALTLPTSTVLLRASKTGYRSFQSYHDVLRISANLELQLRSATQFTSIFTGLGVTETATQGVILVHFFMPDGVTAPAGFGATLGAGGGTRFVVSSSGPTRQNTTAAGDSTLVIANVPVGTTTVAAMPPTGVTCDPDAAVTSFRVDPQTVTTVNFRCR